MASADFCIARIASSLTPLALSDGQCRPPGIRHTSFIWRDMDLLLLLRLGIGLCFVWQTYPHKSLISIFCSCPPNFVLDFLHPHPHGHKLVFDYLIPPNWLTGDLHSRCCVMSCVPNAKKTGSKPVFSIRKEAWERPPPLCSHLRHAATRTGADACTRRFLASLHARLLEVARFAQRLDETLLVENLLQPLESAFNGFALFQLELDCHSSSPPFRTFLFPIKKDPGNPMRLPEFLP